MSTHYNAAALDGFGDASALRLRKLPRRAPGRGEIEVRVRAASVNPIDVRRRAGYGKRLFALLGAARLPLVLGNDFAGVVTAVGKGASPFRVGDAVFGAKPPSSAGSHASHLTVGARHAVLQPVGADEAALATLPYNFLTVSRALAGAGLDDASASGRKVLVHGATGGLGLLAIQILHGWGAQVVAVGGAAGLDACMAAGADMTVDRRRTPLHALPADFCATLNLANWDDEAALLRLLAPGALGHATTVHPMLANFDRDGLLRGALANMRQKKSMRASVPPGARYSWTVFAADGEALAQLANRACSLIAPARTTFSLNEAAQAHLHVERRLPGRAVLLPARA